MKLLKNLSQEFESICTLLPEKTAIILGKEQVTYQQLLKRVNDWREELDIVGMRAQDRVLVMVNEYIDFIAIWFALWGKKCVPIPLETSLSSYELQNAITESKANWFVTDNIASQRLFPDDVVRFSRTNSTWSIIQFGSIHVDIPTTDVALLFYTSGTTGPSKCVIFDHQGIAENIFDEIQAFQISPHDICLTPLIPALPATLATIIWPTLCTGATLILLPKSTPGQLLRTIEERQITIFYAVPYIYALLSSSMNQRKSSNWKSVRLCLSSSALLSETIFNDFYNFSQVPIRSIYCTSEAGACTYNQSTDIACILSSVGRPFSHTRLQIVDDRGAICPAGAEGEIFVKGRHTACGYLHQPLLQEQVFHDGWVRTGDLGFIDTQGYLYLTGRLSETLNISGHLVNPQEVERILTMHASVAEASVYSRSDPKIGEIVCTDIVVREGTITPTSEELLHLCANHLAHYKIPRHISFVQNISKSRYGKIRRRFNDQNKETGV